MLFHGPSLALGLTPIIFDYSLTWWVAVLPLLAFGLDLLLGDPAWFPHPVRGLGLAIGRLEIWSRNSGLSLRIAGMLSVLALCLAMGITVIVLAALPMVGVLIMAYLAYAGLALGCLLREGRRALRLILMNDIEAARLAVGRLVSRDTSNMDSFDLAKTLAETLSENLNDGFTAPLFYLVLSGPAGLWIYKTVSTFDSMWGYKNERFHDLGWFGATMDDALAYVPARLTAFLLVLAGWLLFQKRCSWERIRLAASRMESPNAGWPMAAAAEIMQGTMGGPAVYWGEVKIKPQLGPSNEVWDRKKMEGLFRLLFLASITGIILLTTFAGVFWLGTS